MTCIAGLLGLLLALTGAAHAACVVQPRATVPLTDVDGHVLVTVSINDTDATFVLDSGAERTLVSEAAARSLGLQRDEWVASTVMGIGGVQERPNALPRSMRLGGLTLRRHTLTADTSVMVGPVPLTEVAGRIVVGLLGRDFLAPYDLDVDPSAGKLTLYEVADCAGRFLPWSTPYVAIPVMPSMNTALVLQTVLDGRPLRALLDTGASASLLTAPGMYRLGIAEAALAGDPAATGAGVGPRSVPMRLHRFGELRVGPDITRLPMIWVAPVHVVPIVDMLLGADWLRTRHVWLSFATKQVFVAGR
jgi:hypothetical protein